VTVTVDSSFTLALLGTVTLRMMPDLEAPDDSVVEVIDKLDSQPSVADDVKLNVSEAAPVFVTVIEYVMVEPFAPDFDVGEIVTSTLPVTWAFAVQLALALVE
jgi:hypothetical protein